MKIIFQLFSSFGKRSVFALFTRFLCLKWEQQEQGQVNVVFTFDERAKANVTCKSNMLDSFKSKFWPKHFFFNFRCKKQNYFLRVEKKTCMIYRTILERLEKKFNEIFKKKKKEKTQEKYFIKYYIVLNLCKMIAYCNHLTKASLTWKRLYVTQRIRQIW